MAEDVTIGELARRHGAEVEAVRRNHEALDRRITELAASGVSTAAFAAEMARWTERLADIREDIARLDTKFEAHQVRAASRTLVILSGTLFPILVLIMAAVIFSALGGNP